MPQSCKTGSFKQTYGLEERSCEIKHYIGRDYYMDGTRGDSRVRVDYQLVIRYCATEGKEKRHLFLATPSMQPIE